MNSVEIDLEYFHILVYENQDVNIYCKENDVEIDIMKEEFDEIITVIAEMQMNKN